MAEIHSFPNNQDTYIGAEPVMKWLHGRTSGVFGAENNGAVSAVQGQMAVTVSDAIGWISNEEGNGVVWWNDNEKVNDEKLLLNIDMADGMLNRIDRVIVSWETTNYVALPEIVILKGSTGSTPTPPTLTNDENVRQISLAQIYIAAGTLSITPVMITDERLDGTVCGIVTDHISIDTSVLNAQFMDWFENIKAVLNEDVAGNLLTIIENLTYSDVNAAPAGYGLGETSGKLALDVDTIVDGGFYILDNDRGTVNSAIDHGVMFVLPCDVNNYVTQIQYSRTCKKYIRCLYNGVWTEWKQDNPNKSYWTEYLTTEYFTRKPVYCQVIDCGKFPDDTSTKTVSHGSGSKTLVRMDVTIKNDDSGSVYPNPQISDNTRLKVWFTPAHISMSSSASGYGHYSAVCALYYTKG